MKKHTTPTRPVAANQAPVEPDQGTMAAASAHQPARPHQLRFSFMDAEPTKTAEPAGLPHSPPTRKTAKSGTAVQAEAASAEKPRVPDALGRNPLVDEVVEALEGKRIESRQRWLKAQSGLPSANDMVEKYRGMMVLAAAVVEDVADLAAEELDNSRRIALAKHAMSMMNSYGRLGATLFKLEDKQRRALAA